MFFAICWSLIQAEQMLLFMPRTMSFLCAGSTLTSLSPALSTWLDYDLYHEDDSENKIPELLILSKGFDSHHFVSGFFSF
jgi:hypothetical protein